MAYFAGSGHDALVYTAVYFSAPFLVLNLIGSLYALIRWFIFQQPEIADEIITFLHATWSLTLYSFIAYQFVDAGGDISKMIAAITAIGKR
ncbi:MAG: hypothetical protein WCL30_00065 [Pseudomonadota bacterium]